MEWKRLVRARTVEPLGGFRVRVEFEDGTEREIDLEQYLYGPIFKPIRGDPAVFRAVRIEGGVLTGDNGADIDPDVLYRNLAPVSMEIEREPAH